jgi:hypothetical protein
MNYSVKVLVGEGTAVTYNFSTSAERDAFCLALSQFSGSDVVWSVTA